jgi:hypothetical protein
VKGGGSIPIFLSEGVAAVDMIGGGGGGGLGSCGRGCVIGGLSPVVVVEL